LYRNLFKSNLPIFNCDHMELSEYPDSFKASEDFADIQKNPFRQISANLLDAIDSYFEDIDEKKEINGVPYYKYEDGLTNLLFDERKKSEKRILSKNGAVAKYIKSIFKDYGVSDKDFNTFFDLFASFDTLSLLFEDFVNEHIYR